ncbi:MAG TPA: glycoside hydrolase family 97 catalytic domain-containing protein, partial [Bacteroidales bacterium]
GLHRTYPNVITSEGVVGLEHNKWSDKVSPQHDLTLPFIRMVAGPMDYTPGAMLTANQENFRDIFNEPMSQGTRCHQLALYVVFESPLQMLADNPSNYRKEKESMEFLSSVPTTWDDTRVLEAKIAEYILMARKKGEIWYLGALTDWDDREMTVDFSFLGEGEYTVEIWQDGVNADKHAADFKKVIKTVNRLSNLPIHLAPGGGWAAVVYQKNK